MTRSILATVLALSAVFEGCSGADAPPPPPTPSVGEPVPLPEDPYRQFDFWLGEWDVANQQLRGGTWRDSGSAIARIQPVADGRAVLEQWTGKVNDSPLIGFSLRAYDRALDRWVIYLNWHGGRPSGFSVMHGQRNGERIEQFPPDDDQQVRYSFSQVHEGSCQWDEARSEDGESWITRWVMQFSRRGPSLAMDASNAPIVPAPEAAAAYPETRQLDWLVGAWEGSARGKGPDGSEVEGAVRARVTAMIEGFGLLQFVDTEWGDRSMAALGWDDRSENWVAIHVDQDTEGIRRLETDVVDEREVTFVATDGGTTREIWSCAEADRCSLRRARSDDGGVSWSPVLEAELTRSVSTAAWIDIPRAQAPFPGVLVGGQPTLEQLEWAAKNGYRTVINTRSEAEAEDFGSEPDRVRELGMNYVFLPVAGAAGINSDNARRLAEALEPDALPAIVHCASGNRVGALFALKAHEIDGASPEEALQIGQSAGLTRLEPLVRERLGLPK